LIELTSEILERSFELSLIIAGQNIFVYQLPTERYIEYLMLSSDVQKHSEGFLQRWLDITALTAECQTLSLNHHHINVK